MDLNELESRLQTLIEVGLVQVLPGRKMEDVVIQKLAAAINSNVKEQDGLHTAPNVITLIVNPASVSNWQDNQLLEMIVQSLDTASQEAGYHFASKPTITISTDDNLPINDINIMASHRVEPLADTKANPMETYNPPNDSNKIPENAFLIIGGVKVYSLSQPVINIGRRLDNQLVIDDPRVSRNHAQLRVIKGRFVVFDLNSTGGTFVNGQRTNQCVLYPGDVISLAGVPLIFGQENPPLRSGLTDTAPRPFPPGERPTAMLKDISIFKRKKK
jgi:hypothetical protein